MMAFEPGRIEMTTRRTFLVGVAAAGVLGMAGGLRAEDPAAAAAQAAAQPPVEG